MLSGADGKGWSMYIDNSRSWFVHAGVHAARADGGISTGSVVGVLLDVDRHQLSFYLDGELHGPPGAVMSLPGGGQYFPAVSINRNVQLTVHSGLLPPADCSDSDDSAA